MSQPEKRQFYVFRSTKREVEAYADGKIGKPEGQLTGYTAVGPLSAIQGKPTEWNEETLDGLARIVVATIAASSPSFKAHGKWYNGEEIAHFSWKPPYDSQTGEVVSLSEEKEPWRGFIQETSELTQEERDEFIFAIHAAYGTCVRDEASKRELIRNEASKLKPV